MNIDVIGRHALLFDDDTTAAFVNSNDALVEWNSLLIDRYDVRHLLSGPPPSRRRRNPRSSLSPPSRSSIDSELDHERYLDLPPPSDEQESDAVPETAGGFNAVPFSYGNTEDSNNQKNAESGLEGPAFHPPFPVPDSLIQKLPPTEKVHQIIARTALFVSKNGGQSEIVLRVKQGGNPTFGFLMPDHHLHAYFRFLVDHQELLQAKDDGKSENEEKVANTEHAAGAGALSLLGSLYGTGEDEDGIAEYPSASEENVSGNTSDVRTTISLTSERIESPMNTAGKDEAVSKRLLPSKEEAPVLRKNSFASALKAGSIGGMRKGEFSGSLSVAPDKVRASSLPTIPKVDPLLVEPPSDVKRLVDKIVEFIMKNGKQFEAVLVEQDHEHGRFPFLMSSNQYHPYYLKVLHKAQESKLTVKSFLNEKDGSIGHAADKKIPSSKEHASLSLESVGYDIPYDSDRKEKFKMVIGKSKKDGADLPSKPTQQPLGVRVDAAQAAAILQAATRGIKNPNLGILSNTYLNDNDYGPNSEGVQPSSLGSLHSSQPESLSIPVAKTIAKTAAIEVASEADSSEAHLPQEQKLKAERLKRAKMFVAMLKSGAAPSKAEPLRGFSAEPQASGGSGFAAEISLAAKEREGSSAPLDVDTSDKNVKLEKEHFNDEWRSRRKYRARSSKHEEDEAKEEDDDDDDDDDGGEEKRLHSHKHSRKKHRSHHSSLEDEFEEDKNEDGRKKNRSYCSSRKGYDEEEHDEERYRYTRKKRRSLSSYEDDDDDDEEDDEEHERDRKHSRKRHRSYHSSHEDDKQEDEDESDYKYSRKKRSSPEEDDDKRDQRRSRRKHRSHQSSHHSRDRHKHTKRHSSKDRASRHRHKHDVSSDEELRCHGRANKRTKESHSEREELEEGEISSKISDQSRRGYVGDGGDGREASVDISSSYQDRTALTQPSETTEVSDDLRAKIRAMLMSTL